LNPGYARSRFRNSKRIVSIFIATEFGLNVVNCRHRQ
jgi:hypothetical protein